MTFGIVVIVHFKINQMLKEEMQLYEELRKKYDYISLKDNVQLIGIILTGYQLLFLKTYMCTIACRKITV